MFLVIILLNNYLGGHNGLLPQKSTEVYNTKLGKNGKWELCGEMNIEREIFAHAVIKNKYIYVFGGFKETNLDSIEKFDYEKQTWELLSTQMPRPVQNGTAVTVNEHEIYLIGGSNGNFQNFIDIFNVDEKIFKSAELTLKIPRRRAHCFQHNNKVYISFYISINRF